MYQGHTDEAEIYLKKTVRCILNSNKHALNLRIISKLFPVVTWYCIDMKVEGAGDLFKQTLEFCEENSDTKGFPKEVISYLYYDVERYYDMLYTIHKKAHGLTDKLKEMRLQGLTYSEQAVKTLKKFINVENAADLGTEDISSTNRDRLVLMVSDYVCVLMGCGAEFDCTDISLVTKEEIEKSEGLLMEIKGFIPHVPLVHKLLYQKAMCDLHFVKRENAQALKIAKDFLATTTVTDVYEKARRRAAIRVKNISGYL